MSITLDALVRDMVTQPRSALQINEQVVMGIWRAFCSFIERSMLSGKAVNVPSFGTFTFRVENIDLGHYSKVIRVPAFVLSEQFARPYAISFKKVAPSGKIPTMVVSFSTVGDSSGVPRDVAAAVLKDLLQRLGEQARDRRPVRLDFGVGTMQISGGVSNMVFHQQFVKRVEEVDRVDSRASARSATQSRGSRTSSQQRLGKENLPLDFSRLHLDNSAHADDGALSRAGTLSSMQRDQPQVASSAARKAPELPALAQTAPSELGGSRGASRQSRAGSKAGAVGPSVYDDSTQLRLIWNMQIQEKLEQRVSEFEADAEMLS